jgi:long-chain acyl-CoA synthetase
MADHGDREEIERRLLSAGAPFEVREEEVLGESMAVFARRARSLREVLAASGEADDAEYLVFVDPEGNTTRRISYREHLASVASVAKALRDRFGVQRGDRVAILAGNGPAWIVTFWATVSLGAIVVGMNAWWAGDEIRFALDDAEPKVLVADRKRLDRIDAALAVPVVEIETDFASLENYDRSASLPETAIDEDDAASILYTSGTTGRPKGVVSTHRNVLAMSAVQLFHGARVFMLHPPDAEVMARLPTQRCVLVANPLFHVSGLFTQVVTFLIARAKTVWTSGRFDPELTLRLIERERVTGWSPHGPMAPRLLAQPSRATTDVSSVLSVGTGGAPVPPELQARLREAFPNAAHALTIGYGMTECTAIATMSFGDELRAHPTCVGRPLPTVQLEIRDEEGRTLPEGEEGEIHVRSPLVMKEYWRRPAETRETILPGRWLRTGDVGRVVDGRLFIDARKRDLILRGAENVYPAEIELRLAAHPTVREVAVVGVDHPELGQEACAIVVPHEGAALDTDALAAWVRATLAYYKVPTRWEVRNEPLPRNASGKVMKHVLRGDAANTFREE